MIDANYEKDIIIALYVEQNQQNEIEKASTAIFFFSDGPVENYFWTPVCPHALWLLRLLAGKTLAR